MRHKKKDKDHRKRSKTVAFRNTKMYKYFCFKFLNDICFQCIKAFHLTITTQEETMLPTAISTIVHTCHCAALQSRRAAITCCPLFLSLCQNLHVPVTILCLWPVWSVCAPVNHLAILTLTALAASSLPAPCLLPVWPLPFACDIGYDHACMSSCSFLIFFWNNLSFLLHSCWHYD